MSATLDRPPVHVSDSASAGSVSSHAASGRDSAPRRRSRSFIQRYRPHLWVGAVSLVIIAVAATPLLMGYPSRPPVAPAAATPPQLSTNISITTSEFKFSPTTLHVPVGQNIQLTLDNTGVVEHDVTIPAANFSLLAKPGESATGAFTIDKPGVFDFICSIPGHKDAGMKGTLTVVDGSGTAPVVAPAHDTGSMSTSANSVADIKPLPAGLQRLPAPVVAPPIDRSEPAYMKFELETRKVTARMADGVAYEYWTFNGTVPGPMLRVREGDTVEMDLSNAADAGVTHSIDLHAVTGPGGGATVTQVMPGESASFTFKALTPGVYVYHCATPMVAQHIASGMYGLIVVEPKGGLSAVDHELYVMEGDFYLQGRRGDEGLRAFDLNKMLDERPDYVLFNGSVGANTGANAFHARVGESVRIFFGVGGPNLDSSFHVIGEIFDRVYPEGALANPVTDLQTTHVPAGGATVVEFTTQVPGTYTMVDHSLGRLEKGAAAQLVVEGAANPEIFQAVRPGSAGAGGH